MTDFINAERQGSVGLIQGKPGGQLGLGTTAKGNPRTQSASEAACFILKLLQIPFVK